LTKSTVVPGLPVMEIYPRKVGPTWIFDDRAKGITNEPFVGGTNQIIDSLVDQAKIPNARFGFALRFSSDPFPGYQKKLIWMSQDNGGNWYLDSSIGTVGWLCPQLFAYFEEAPNELYAAAEDLE
jgi:hypothetical protein